MTHWEDKYRANTTPWDRGGASPALASWLAAGGRAHARILVPGCGRGHEVVTLASQGFQVTGLDIAPTALAQLRDALVAAGSTADLVCDDVFAWLPSQPFDAIYEQTCLCALDPATWPAYAQQLHAWLRPGGHLLALFMQTNKEGGPPFHCDLAAMRALFPDTHWQWPDTGPERVDHPMGIHELASVLIRR